MPGGGGDRARQTIDRPMVGPSYREDEGGGKEFERPRGGERNGGDDARPW